MFCRHFCRGEDWVGLKRAGTESSVTTCPSVTVWLVPLLGWWWDGKCTLSSQSPRQLCTTLSPSLLHVNTSKTCFIFCIGGGKTCFTECLAQFSSVDQVKDLVTVCSVSPHTGCTALACSLFIGWRCSNKIYLLLTDFIFLVKWSHPATPSLCLFEKMEIYYV